MSENLTLSDLRKLVDSEAVAIRGKAILGPVGGPGDKIFPPTYSVDERRREPGAKYAFEKRLLAGGEIASCVLLDSVQSQANRMEEALQALWERKKITLPVVLVDFSDIAPEVGIVTSLSAPHRIADAVLRDSMLGNTFFRLSDLGKSFTHASPQNAGPMFGVCPTGLVFGLWDSTGPKGGSGAKFARALVSEIVGVGVESGVKTASRIDPLGIMKDSATIFVAKARDADGNITWTPHASEAEPNDLTKPPKTDGDTHLAKKYGKHKDTAGKPSAIVHGNIAPSIDEVAGGVTIDHAEQIVVLSLAALRRLSFGGGDSEARTVLAALGLLAVLASEDRGYDLRSRCLLAPQTPHGVLKLESIAPDGSAHPLTLSLVAAIELYQDAVNALPESLRFAKSGHALAPGESLAQLKPSDKLQYLVEKSRELAAGGGDSGDS